MKFFRIASTFQNMRIFHPKFYYIKITDVKRVNLPYVIRADIELTYIMRRRLSQNTMSKFLHLFIDPIYISDLRYTYPTPIYISDFPYTYPISDMYIRPPICISDSDIHIRPLIYISDFQYHIGPPIYIFDFRFIYQTSDLYI